MKGLYTVFRKELADVFSSRRFIILLALIYIAGLSSVYVALQNIRADAQASSEFVFLRLFTTSGGVLPSFISFVVFFIPIIGIALGFDAINGEKASGNLSRLLSQPIYRDVLINGKFLAGVTTIAIMLLSIVVLIGGIGLRSIGVPPTAEEAWRLFFFILMGLFYGAFWLGLSILFSVVLERLATSVLAAVAVWIFFTFFMPIIAGALADAMVPDAQTVAQQLRHFAIQTSLLRISPHTLFTEIIVALLLPQVRTLGPIMVTELPKMLPNPLSLSQSLLLVWPHLTTLVSLTIICFAVSYVIFLRQEIRST